MNVLLKWRDLPKAVGTFVRERTRPEPVATEDHHAAMGTFCSMSRAIWKAFHLMHKEVGTTLMPCVFFHLRICLHLKTVYFISLPNSVKSLPLMRLCGDLGPIVMEENDKFFQAC